MRRHKHQPCLFASVRPCQELRFKKSKNHDKQSGLTSDGFTLLELLVAITILVVMLLLVASVTSNVSSIFRREKIRSESFKDARLAFQTITRTLSQATLNTYLDYDESTKARRYLRKSELKFVCGPTGNGGSLVLPGTPGTGGAVIFQAPLGYTQNAALRGLESLLNTCGYFVSFTTNTSLPNHVAKANNPYRYRLMQLLDPTESNSIHSSKTSTDWFAGKEAHTAPVASNIIALIIRPVDPGTESMSPAVSPNDSYEYDSTMGVAVDPQPITANQLPPVVLVTLIAIDEVSASRIQKGNAPPVDIASALANKFLDRDNYETDLASLTKFLTTKNIAYRVFSTAVPIRESKWTK